MKQTPLKVSFSQIYEDGKEVCVDFRKTEKGYVVEINQNGYESKKQAFEDLNENLCLFLKGLEEESK